MTNDIRQLLDARLTPEQRDAALNPAAEVLCLACAGSGKSTTMAYRIVRLLAEGNPPDSIVAFTFTEKAAESIKRRVAAALAAAGLEVAAIGAMYIGTIHSYCQHILGEMDAIFRQFDVLDDNRFTLYLMSRYPHLGLQRFRPRARGNGNFDTISQVGRAWSVANDEMLDTAVIGQHDPEIAGLLQSLDARMRQDQFIDFSSMIRRVVEALRRGDARALAAIAALRHLMVDEYQDVNPSQEELIRLLHARSTTLFVVGDDDQSIYAWRGAEVDNILTFHQRYPNCSRLSSDN